MKRNIAIIILAIVGVLKACGIDLQMGEAQADIIAGAIALIIGAIGTVESLIKKAKAARAAKKIA
jgi:hypothetical protein